MPTVVDQEVKQPLPQPESQAAPELFAAEIKMEEKSSSLLPLIFVLGLVIVVGGTIYYFIKGAREKLEMPAATAAVNQILKQQGPSVVRFSTGVVVSSMDEKPNDPHYKLLVKGGILETKPKGYNSIYSNMTPAGEKLLSGINGVEKVKNAKDNTVTYVVPLAQRQLVEVSKITMIRPHLARVDYSWKWVPNRLGQEFDAAGDLVKSFNSWDRATLIKDHGADFFNAPPARSSIVLMQDKNDNWVPYVE